MEHDGTSCDLPLVPLRSPITRDARGIRCGSSSLRQCSGRVVAYCLGESENGTAEAAEEFVPRTIPLHAPLSTGRARGESLLAWFDLSGTEYSLVPLRPPPTLPGPSYLGHVNAKSTGCWLKMVAYRRNNLLHPHESAWM